MLARQMAAPNSPQWFNTGLHWAYGIDGPPQGHYFVDPSTGKLERSTSAYERPAPHACFIQSSTTIWSTKAASWTSGSVRLASSNTASGTGIEFLAYSRRRRAAFRRRQVQRADELPQDRRPRSRCDQERAARLAALPRWWSSISIIPTSKSSSTGKWSRSRRWPRWCTGSRLLNKHLNAVLRAIHDWPADAGRSSTPRGTATCASLSSKPARR